MCPHRLLLGCSKAGARGHLAWAIHALRTSGKDSWGGKAAQTELGPTELEVSTEERLEGWQSQAGLGGAARSAGQV